MQFFFAAFFAYIAGSPFLFQNIYGLSAQAYSFIFGGIGAAVSLAGALPLLILSPLTVIPLVSILSAVSFSLAMKAQGDRAGSASALLGFFSMVAGGLAAPIVGIAGEENALPMAGLMLIGCLAAYASYRLYIAPAHRTER